MAILGLKMAILASFWSISMFQTKMKADLQFWTTEHLLLVSSNSKMMENTRFEGQDPREREVWHTQIGGVASNPGIYQSMFSICEK